jgi:hypothetical protein
MPPNQFDTPVTVKVYEGRHIIQTEVFSDLQMAYLWIQGQIGFYPHLHLRLLEWPVVIRQLYEFHVIDGSGCDVLTSADASITYAVFYNQ